MSISNTSLPWPGAQDSGQGRTSFTLYAPNKGRVSLIGDFNDWNRDADPLETIADGLWSVEKELDAGTVRYQFAVDDLTICDPYARAIEWQDDGPPHALVETGRKPYRWRREDWARPTFNDLILYELLVGDFSPEGTFRGVIDRLDHIADLGINAIQLMPVTQGVQGDHWGYQPAFYFAVKQEYGSGDELKELVDEAHGRGIAVLFDLVLAHSSGECPLSQLYLPSESPWYGPEGIGGKHEFGFPTFDHRKPPTQAFSRDVEGYWLREFRGDGFRYDYIKNIGVEGGKGASFLVCKAREFLPDAYLIGEHLPEVPENINATDLNGSWHGMSSRGLKALLLETEIDGMNWNDLDTVAHMMDAGAFGYERATQMVNYLESHDEQRLMHELRGAGYPEDVALRKALLGIAFLMAMPGEPQIYMGGEWGEDTEKKLDRNPLHWEALETDLGRALADGYRRALRLRRDHPGLRTDNYEISRVDNERKVIAIHRWNEEGDDLMAVANFRGDAQEVPVPLPHGGRWRDCIADCEIEAQGETTYRMEGYSAALFVRL